MTHTDTRQAITEIMASLEENIECDQLINKLADKNIITKDDVSRINRIEELDKMQELLVVLLEKDSALHPLALKILENHKNPSQQNTRRTEQAIAQAAPGSGTVSKPSTERRILSNAEVSENWELKNFLLQLSKEIGEDEFDDMKELMRGENGFKNSALEKIEKPMHFFRQLMNTGRLNIYNLHFLQALVRAVGRIDLNEKVRQFCLNCHKQPIHFFTPSETPENGYRYVKHHIEGDIEKLTNREKERLRAEVADILCVPLTFVFIKGIEPADSLLFTFMVPEEDVSSFIHLYMTEGDSLIEVSVHIQIQGEQLSLSEMPPSETKDPKPLLCQLRNLLEREQRLQEQVEQRDDKLLDLQAELDSKEEDTTVDQVLHGQDVDEEEDTRELRYKYELYKSLVTKLTEVMKTMRIKEVGSNANGINGSLKLSSAAALYKKLLGEIRQHCNTVDMDLVNKLLDTRVLIENTLHEERFRKMQDIIAMLNQSVEELGVMNGVIRMSSSMVGGSSTFLQDILAVQEQTKALAIEQQQKEEPHGVEVNGIIGLHVLQSIYPGPIEIKLKPEQQQLLMQITKELSSKEKQKLKTFLCFSEVEKEELKQHPDKLLELALMRELRKGRIEPMEIILAEILAMIRKAQLIQKYFNIPEPPPKITTRHSGEKRRSKRIGRSETPQRPRNDSETNR